MLLFKYLNYEKRRIKKDENNVVFIRDCFINKVVLFSDTTKNRLWCASKGEDCFDIYTRGSLRLLGLCVGYYHFDIECVV